MSNNSSLPAIVAVSTPAGTGAIAVVRLSGTNCHSIASKVFHSRKPLEQIPARHITFGRIVDKDGKILDTALAVRFDAPQSYTGEDMVEISCHGGPLITSRLLELLIASGARLAEPGEFTLRAFLNGKLDLTQAEAVMDLISAKTPVALRAAANQLEGILGQEIQAIRQQLLQTLAHLEAWIDFPEEGISPDDSNQLCQRIQTTLQSIHRLLATSEEGRILREGARIAICGLPNAGKSSLLNRLLGFERAIVSDIPGTTRDTIEEFACLRGIPCLITDTAGLRKTDDPIEKEGVLRAQKAIQKSDLILHIYDASQSLSPPPLDFSLEQASILICCANKIDLLPADQLAALPTECISISCQTGEGISQLVDYIVQKISTSFPEGFNSRVAINARHKGCLERAIAPLQAALTGLHEGMELELVAIELRSALATIGEIVGTPDAEEILGEIFAQFCIGK